MNHFAVFRKEMATVVWIKRTNVSNDLTKAFKLESNVWNMFAVHECPLHCCIAGDLKRTKRE